MKSALSSSLSLPMLVAFVFFVLSCEAFVPSSSSSIKTSNSRSRFFLHPDQGEDLMAAASELMKSQTATTDEDEEGGVRAQTQAHVPVALHHDEGEKYDDTKKHSHSSSSSSASSRMSSAPSSSLTHVPQKWWSSTFSSFIRRRHNRSG